MEILLIFRADDSKTFLEQSTLHPEDPQSIILPCYEKSSHFWLSQIQGFLAIASLQHSRNSQEPVFSRLSGIALQFPAREQFLEILWCRAIILCLMLVDEGN